MAHSELPPGTLLRGRYRLGATLGRSRVAITYEATDEVTREPCVVKELSVAGVVRSSDGSESFSGDFTKLIDLFEREARVLANLTHPGVPRLIDHFTEEGGDGTRLYTVQEFVQGRTLAALIEGGRHFSEAEVAEIARKVAEVLAHLHALSPPLVHRDIKPSNVLLDERGEVHLIDFGAVKTTLEVDDLGGQTVVGTFGYMPREQYEARALPASDVYALGATLVHLLSHRAPHELPRKDGGRVDFRSRVNVSEGLARVLERMLEPAPEDRFPNGAALLRALQPGASVPSRRAPRTPVPVSRPFAAVVAALVAVGLGAAFLIMAPAAPDAPPSGAPPARPTGPTGASGGGVLPVRPVDGVLTVDVYRDFRYVPSGWPMGRSVSQTGIGVMRDFPREPVTLPDFPVRPDEVLHGGVTLGNGDDPVFAIVLTRTRNAWELWVDRNNDEDLTNDGPPEQNQGDGTIMAARLLLEAEVRGEEGPPVPRPYDLWLWFNRSEAGAIEGRLYGTNHWSGTIEVDERAYEATAFEFDRHDALYRESGLCIDLDRDGTCQEGRELFLDGDVVAFPERTLRLRLLHP